MRTDLTEVQKQDLAKEFLVDLSTVKAVYNVESSGHGFDNITGRIKIQFEPTIFSNLLSKKGIAHTIKVVYITDNTGKKIQEYELTCNGITITNGVQGQQAEYTTLEQAKRINSTLALESTSWGLGQIMGFNYKLAGYNSPEEMMDDFLKGEYNQLRGMLMFIKNNHLMLHYLQIHDWAGFASLYNGPEYKKFNYDNRLKDSYSKVA